MPSGSVTSSSTALGVGACHVLQRVTRGVDPLHVKAGGTEPTIEQRAYIVIVLDNEHVLTKHRGNRSLRLRKRESDRDLGTAERRTGRF